jgi:hypothetical protein
MKAHIALVIVCLIVSLSIVALPVKAQEPLNLTIKPDGSIEPNTDFTWLQQNGNTYTFIVAIFGTITVQKAGITIDGAGHTLQGNPREANLRGINLVGHDETFNAYGNVLVKNLRIYNFSDGIYTPSNNNSFIGNRFENARLHIIGGSEVGNVIKHNVFINAQIFVDYNNGGLDVITENNFVDSTIFVDLAAPPVVDKNFWSNYTAEYPGAKELDDSGVWDTPNVYDKFIGGSHGKDPCIDYHPLVNPITDLEITNFNILLPSATPISTEHPPINTGAEPPQTESFPIGTLLVVVFVVAIGIVTATLLLFGRHRKMQANSQKRFLALFVY